MGKIFGSCARQQQHDFLDIKKLRKDKMAGRRPENHLRNYDSFIDHGNEESTIKKLMNNNKLFLIQLGMNPTTLERI